MSKPTPCVVWVGETDLPAQCDTTAIEPPVLSSALSYASTVVYNLTRRRWPGLCTDVYNPLDGPTCWYTGCSLAGLPGTLGLPYAAEFFHGANDAWGVGFHYVMDLPATDVRAINYISIAGVTIDAADYELRDGHRLIAKRRPDGTIRGWPCGTDLYSATPFEIGYTHGAEPPPDAKTAAGILGYELALGWTPSCAANCRLPKRVTTMTRGGTTFAVVDPLTLFDKGLTGLPDVDMLVQILNRGENMQRAMVLRPGSPTKASRIT